MAGLALQGVLPSLHGDRAAPRAQRPSSRRRSIGPASESQGRRGPGRAAWSRRFSARWAPAAPDACTRPPPHRRSTRGLDARRSSMGSRSIPRAHRPRRLGHDHACEVGNGGSSGRFSLQAPVDTIVLVLVAGLAPLNAGNRCSVAVQRWSSPGG